MRLAIDVLLDYGFVYPADVLLQVEVAAMPDQRIESEALTVWSDTPIAAVVGEDGIGQRCWARGQGRLVAEYHAVVAIDRPPVELARYGATSVRELPGATVGYLLPSRYCEADRFDNFVRQTFGGLRGGPLAAAIADWIRTNLTYASGSSDGSSTAISTFVERRGVCRDYAHLLVAMARAAEIPARCVAVYAPGVDPPDFHAVAELWLDGAWRLVDATGMASCADLARVAVGRDATDIAFMTIFGRADLWAQRVAVRALPDGSHDEAGTRLQTDR